MPPPFLLPENVTTNQNRLTIVARDVESKSFDDCLPVTLNQNHLTISRP